MNADHAHVRQSAAYEAAIDFLYSRINYEKVGHAIYSAANYRLDRMRRLLELIGNPQADYRIIHIAGTKGKGTTSMVASHLLKHCGYHVGTFTSPHLRYLEERIQCDETPCSASDLIGLVDRIRDAAERLENEGGGRPTFFEMTTAMGMLHFSQTKCDVAVIEVGLGGRLDSTNVCQPDVTVITSISFDHQAQLGNTITSIAREKAGIIKPQIPVVCSARHEDARQVVMQQAAAMNAPLHLIDRDFSAAWQRIRPEQETRSALAHVAEIHFSATTPRTAIANATWRIPILGRHQADNIAAALMAVDLLIESAPPSDKPKAQLLSVPGLQAAFSTMQLPARLQQVACSPVQIIDTAHNPASIAATLGALEDHFPGQPLTVVFASSRDKEFGEMLKLLLRRCQRLVLTAYQNNPRALAVPELQTAAAAAQAELHQQAADSNSDSPEMAEIIVADQPLGAWQAALSQASPGSIICGTGSFFLAAELLPLFD